MSDRVRRLPGPGRRDGRLERSPGARREVRRLLPEGIQVDDCISGAPGLQQTLRELQTRGQIPGCEVRDSLQPRDAVGAIGQGGPFGPLGQRPQRAEVVGIPRR